VVNCRATLPSDEETLAALASSLHGVDLEIHGRWIEILGREAISCRFFLALQGLVIRLSDGASGQGSVTVREIALLYISRHFSSPS
jgi:hypothetical protein